MSFYVNLIKYNQNIIKSSDFLNVWPTLATSITLNRITESSLKNHLANWCDNL